MEDTAALHRSNADAAHAVGQQQQHLALEEAIAEITAALEKSSSSGSESDEALAQVLQALLDQLQEIASAADITKEAAAEAGELQVEIAAAEAEAHSEEKEKDDGETDSETEEEEEEEDSEDTFAGLGNKDGILLEEEDVILPTATFTDGAILMPTTSTTATTMTSTASTTSTATVQKRDLFDDTTAFVDALSDGTAGESIHRRRDDEAALERHMARVMA